jgi:hypothetical protein
VRARYLAIADHYMALADAEIRTDQLIRRKRLDLMRSEREKSQRAADITPDADLKVDRREVPRAPEPARLRLIKSGKRLDQRRSLGPAQPSRISRSSNRLGNAAPVNYIFGSADVQAAHIGIVTRFV